MLGVEVALDGAVEHDAGVGALDLVLLFEPDEERVEFGRVGASTGTLFVMMDTLTTSPMLVVGWLGLAAGFAVAIPLGPIGLLIAATDLAYGALALTATAWAARIIEPIARPSTYLAAGVIAVIGLRGLLE